MNKQLKKKNNWKKYIYIFVGKLLKRKCIDSIMNNKENTYKTYI